MNLIASSPDVGLSGANVLLVQVLRSLAEQGCDVKWLVSTHHGIAETEWIKGLGVPFNVMPATKVGAVRRRQEALIDALRESSPCTYLPNYDFDMLWAAEALPSECRMVFIMHCDDRVYYKAIEERGQAMDAIVCVSSYLAGEVKRRWPNLAERVHHIPFGVEVPPLHTVGKVSLNEGPLEIAYCGRLSQEQKRIDDLAEIILECHRQKIPVRFHIAGSGPDENAFVNKIQAAIKDGSVKHYGKLPHDQVITLLARAHTFILTSAYEGLPVSLLEAMASGSVPLVSAVKSGIPEIIENGINGIVFPIGDIQECVKSIKHLSENEQDLGNLSSSARATISEKGYTLDSSVSRYLNLCSSVHASEQAIGLNKRRYPLTPPHYRLYRKILKKLRRG